MDFFKNLYKKNNFLHHVYFLVGEKNKIFDDILFFLENELKFKTLGNPDFVISEFDNLNIDDSREIIRIQEKKSITNGKKVFIIKTDFITEEAQNSLLKVFEEPTPGTHFFIISPQDILIPTLKSRVFFINEKNLKNNYENDFFNLDLNQRMELVKKITESIKDEESTKQDAINFLNQIEMILYSKGVSENYEKLIVCQKTRDNLYNRGAPIKMVLENLVLNI